MTIVRVGSLLDAMSRWTSPAERNLWGRFNVLSGIFTPRTGLFEMYSQFTAVPMTLLRRCRKWLVVSHAKPCVSRRPCRHQFPYRDHKSRTPGNRPFRRNRDQTRGTWSPPSGGKRGERFLQMAEQRSTATGTRGRPKEVGGTTRCSLDWTGLARRRESSLLVVRSPDKEKPLPRFCQRRGRS